MASRRWAKERATNLSDDKYDAGQYNLSLLERTGVVVVDHLEDLARRGQELGAELLVGGGRRALAPLALLRHLLQALREAAVDRRLPCAQINQ